MPCVCVVELKEIVHSGSDIGDDWRYEVGVGGVEARIDGQGHGEARQRIRLDPPRRWKLLPADCSEVVSIEVRVKAEEEDLFANDRGENTRSLIVACPEPGEGPNEFLNQQLVARVAEEPEFLKRVHWVTFIFDVETRCEAEGGRPDGEDP